MNLKELDIETIEAILDSINVDIPIRAYSPLG